MRVMTEVNEQIIEAGMFAHLCPQGDVANFDVEVIFRFCREAARSVAPAWRS